MVILTSNFFNSEPIDYNSVNPQFATPTPTPPEKDDYVPANTPTPVATPTPEVPSFGGLFIAELSNKLGIKSSRIIVNHCVFRYLRGFDCFLICFVAFPYVNPFCLLANIF